MFRRLCKTMAQVSGGLCKSSTHSDKPMFHGPTGVISPASGMCRCEKLPVQGLNLTASAPTVAEQAVIQMEVCNRSVCAFACVLSMLALDAMSPYCSVKHCCSYIKA